MEMLIPYLMDAEELLSTVMASVIPTGIAFVAWRNRVTRPITARLFITAAICLLLPIAIGMAQQLLGVNDVFELGESSEPGEPGQTFVLESELHPGDSEWQRMIAWQILLSGFHMVAWSLMAWGILRQPDDRPQAAMKS